MYLFAFSFKNPNSASDGVPISCKMSNWIMSWNMDNHACTMHKSLFVKSAWTWRWHENMVLKKEIQRVGWHERMQLKAFYMLIEFSFGWLFKRGSKICSPIVKFNNPDFSTERIIQATKQQEILIVDHGYPISSLREPNSSIHQI